MKDSLTADEAIAQIKEVVRQYTAPAGIPKYEALRQIIDIVETHAATPAAGKDADPCPQCIRGAICKTPLCGRLRAAQAPAAAAGMVNGSYVTQSGSLLAESEVPDLPGNLFDAGCVSTRESVIAYARRIEVLVLAKLLQRNVQRTSIIAQTVSACPSGE